MSKVRTIDTHTHILTQETAALLTKAGAKVPVTITPDDAECAALDVGGVVYRPFPTGGFDIARRLQDMDAAGVDVHVLSATPQTYLYNQDAALPPSPPPSRTTRWPSTSPPIPTASWGSPRCRCRRPSARPTSSGAP